MNEQESIEAIVKELAKNPRIRKAMMKLINPLRKEGDFLTIKLNKKEVEEK